MNLFVIILLKLGYCIVTELLADDKVCNPNGLSVRFSGLRVYSSVIYGLPVRHFWSVVHCNSGLISSMQYFPCNRTTNFMFAQPVKLDNGEFYIFARKKVYALRHIPIYRPFTYVGAVYNIDVLNNATDILAPLQADSSATKFTEVNAAGKKITHVSMLYASFDNIRRGWDAGMDLSPYEYYTYSSEDVSSFWFKINAFINSVDHYTYIDDRFIPWEYDAMESQLSGQADWRKYVNAVISKF